MICSNSYTFLYICKHSNWNLNTWLSLFLPSPWHYELQMYEALPVLQKMTVYVMKSMEKWGFNLHTLSESSDKRLQITKHDLKKKKQCVDEKSKQWYPKSIPKNLKNRKLLFGKQSVSLHISWGEVAQIKKWHCQHKWNA